MSTAIWAGAAERVITPPVGLDMTGFGGRPSGTLGVHDDLYARALVLAEAGAAPERRIALVSTDLLSLGFDIVARVRDGVRAATGIAPDGLFLNSTHTHHGPVSIHLRGLGRRDDAYVAALERNLVGVVADAAARLAPARLAAGRAPVQLGVNRRVRRPDGRTDFGENWDAPADKAVRVLRVETAAGRPLAIVFNHACHALFVGSMNLLTTADFVAYSAAALREALGPGLLPVFLQGCAGNINPVQGGQATFDLAERMGRRLAEAAHAAWQTATPLLGPLHAARRIIRLPLADPPSVEEARRRLDQEQQRLREVKATCTIRGHIEVQEGFVEWAEKLVALAGEGARPRFQDFELQALAVGSEFGLLGMPGEVFVEYAQQIEAASPFPHTMVLAYHNGCIGYVPTAAAFPEGGYEVNTAILLYGDLMMKPESEALIVREAVELLRQVRPA